MDKKILFLISLFFFSCYNPVKKSRELIKKGKYEEAESILLYALKKGKKDSEIYFLLGEINLKKKFYLSALSYFEKVLDKNKFKEDLIINLREIFRETKNKGPEIARKALFLFYLLSPDELSFEEKKFLAYHFFEKQPEEGYNFLENLLKESFDEGLLLDYVKNLYDRGDYERIVSIYNKFNEKINNSKLYLNILFYVGSSYFNIGKSYFESEKIDSAYNYLSKYIAMKSPELYIPRAYFLRGKINLIRGDTLSGYYDFRKVVEILPFKNSDIVQEAREIMNKLRLKGYGG